MQRFIAEVLVLYRNLEAAFYRDAYRDVCQIANERDELKIGDIAQVLTEEVRTSLRIPVFVFPVADVNRKNSVAWRAITNLVSIGEIPELEEMDDEKRAAVLFGRVHGIGPSRAKEL
jgi:hypothetical protein